MRLTLVSANLPSATKQSHSLRASGVMSSQAASAASSSRRAAARSACISVWTVPTGSSVVFTGPA